MLKAAIRLETGLRLIFGLSDANCLGLLDNRPIVFPSSQIGFAGYDFCLTCVHPDGRIPLPRDRPDDPEKFIVVPVPAELLAGVSVEIRAIAAVSYPDWSIVVIRGATEQTMHSRLGQFIGPETRLSISGFAPGSFPVSQN